METNDIITSYLFCYGPLLLIGTVSIVALFIAHQFDTDRIRQYLARQGGVLLTKEWTPFGEGWLGEKNARIYRIRYQDCDGHEHTATCKTSMFAGVYLTADEIVQYVPAIAAISPEDLNRRLQAENQQLRQEVEQLRRELELCKKLDLSVR